MINRLDTVFRNKDQSKREMANDDLQASLPWGLCESCIALEPHASTFQSVWRLVKSLCETVMPVQLNTQSSCFRRVSHRPSVFLYFSTFHHLLLGCYNQCFHVITDPRVFIGPSPLGSSEPIGSPLVFRRFSSTLFSSGSTHLFPTKTTLDNTPACFRARHKQQTDKVGE